MTARSQACKDVRDYPPSLLNIEPGRVRIGVTYKRVWDDGFGARGWKIDAAIGDPVIIASTRETGERIPTSVFVHDILDHFLSGFAISGHRSEAMALIQLSGRTGSDPAPDYEQLVREDILAGNVNGEPLVDFLPQTLTTRLPAQPMPNRERMEYLKGALGAARLLDLLVDHFFALGRGGEEHARLSWRRLGLDRQRRREIGLALQRLLERVDWLAQDRAVESLQAHILISNQRCTLTVNDDTLGQRRFSEPVEPRCRD